MEWSGYTGQDDHLAMLAGGGCSGVPGSGHVRGGEAAAEVSFTQILTSSYIFNIRHEAKDMFYHAYDAYMDNAWPADELMPLSCRGRFRGREPSRGDIDDAMGNFSLTLIDSLDMLVVLGDVAEFEEAVKKVIDTVKFDTDVVVSVFETNIRIVG